MHSLATPRPSAEHAGRQKDRWDVRHVHGQKTLGHRSHPSERVRTFPLGSQRGPVLRLPCGTGRPEDSANLVKLKRRRDSAVFDAEVVRIGDETSLPMLLIEGEPFRAAETTGCFILEVAAVELAELKRGLPAASRTRAGRPPRRCVDGAPISYRPRGLRGASLTARRSPLPGQGAGSRCRRSCGCGCRRASSRRSIARAPRGTGRRRGRT